MPKHVFVLTGAGVLGLERAGNVSRQTGRTGSGAGFGPMKLARRKPSPPIREVLAFYDMRRRNLQNAKPTPAHFALARLGKRVAAGRQLTLMTRRRPPARRQGCVSRHQRELAAPRREARFRAGPGRSGPRWVWRFWRLSTTHIVEATLGIVAKAFRRGKLHRIEFVARIPSPCYVRENVPASIWPRRRAPSGRRRVSHAGAPPACDRCGL